ncbi:acylamino-acid-releasing enzyme-like isoform X1 [Lolium rigidum]|uniref:acylamino-acid-releasing enzyme-like isoform X1 n=1 Tax=Lolium rigidum TaxID=89674 RepID=UPI001F5C7E20|nr:acylamino-acid-releasing enzyme-like isoform X1 [Lolium rigidum]
MHPHATGVEKAAAPYGSWESPISAAAVSAAGKAVEGLAVAGDGRLLWVETRPEEGGRAVLVKEGAGENGGNLNVTPQEFAVRSLAQEYGGGAFAVQGDVVVFSNYSDQRLYKQTIGDNSPLPLTPDYGGSVVRYADGVFDPHFSRYITIMEDHRKSSSNPITTVAAVSTSVGDVNEPTVLVSGNDFYAFPRIDPTDKRMAWIEWSNPNMSWDKAQLWVGYFSSKGEVQKRICVAGEDPTFVEAPTEPKWSSKGELFFITDRQSGFWNIHKWDEQSNVVVQVYSIDAEFSKPMWIFGVSSYDFLRNDDSSQKIACCYRQNGESYVGLLDHNSGSFSKLDLPFSSVTNIVSGDGSFYVEGASGSLPVSVAKVTLDEKRTMATDFSIVWSSSEDITKYTSYFSLPEFMKFPTVIPGQHAYAYFYAPHNHIFQGSSDEKPPLLVRTHGGPTDEARGILDLSVQYWTSRGWALVDVNYGGSAGYGREYRERLLGQWGVVDVNDCCSCATFLVETGRVDGQRLCVTGESAGGFTTLACLAFRETFKAGASLYGIADLASLRAGMHKFEAYYIDNLVGDKQAYFERSPINFVERFTCPVILFQGLEDPVVSPDQATTIYKAIKDKGLPVALVEYEGEQHGFRKAENIKFTLEQAMMFFARLVGHFKVADNITPIKIVNFD